MNIMADDPRTLSLEQTRKFRNLKILVLFLQSEKKFGRYCFYGCYCLPEGSHNIAAGGYGKLGFRKNAFFRGRAQLWGQKCPKSPKMGGIYNNNRILSSIKTRKSRSTGLTKLASTSNSATNALLMNMRLTIPTKAGLAKVVLLSIFQTIMTIKILTIKIDFNPEVQQSGANVTQSSVIRSSKP